jgi:pSer/pThr/pTyr-binding forkhead associated (FHA) protein
MRLFDAVLPQGTHVIGRRAECSIVLDHPSVSRQHATLIVHDRGCTLVNESLSNGIVRNGRPVADRADFRSDTTFAIGEVIVYIEPMPGGSEHALVATADSPVLMTIPLVEGTAVVGRAPTCEVPIDHSSVSRHHAKVVHHRGETVISDMGSTNGTRVNGQPASQPIIVRPGDLVQIGDLSFVLQRTGSERISMEQAIARSGIIVRPPAFRTLALATGALLAIACVMLLILLTRA